MKILVVVDGFAQPGEAVVPGSTLPVGVGSRKLVKSAKVVEASTTVDELAEKTCLRTFGDIHKYEKAMGRGSWKKLINQTALAIELLYYQNCDKLGKIVKF